MESIEKIVYENIMNRYKHTLYSMRKEIISGRKKHKIKRLEKLKKTMDKNYNNFFEINLLIINKGEM